MSPLVDQMALVMATAERSATDERPQQAQLAAAQPLAAVGELTASIIHEIMQPLTGIISKAEAGLRWMNRSEPVMNEIEAALSGIRDEGLRAREMVRGLRMLARNSGAELVEVDLEETVRQVVGLVRADLSDAGIRVSTDISHSARWVSGDPTQLNLVLSNLVRNGLESMQMLQGGRRILDISASLADDGKVKISVADSGAGLSPEIAERIFDPLFTTKKRGMGMGLAICRSIVEAHGGHLTVFDRKPQGTVFVFTISRARTATDER